MAVSNKAILFAWLDGVIDELPNTGQIILNFDGNTVKWELKITQLSQDNNGVVERREVRRSGRLPLDRFKRAANINK